MKPLNDFTNFLRSVDLTASRGEYSHIHIVEMDLPKDIQAINLLYQLYWNESRFLLYEDFFEEYHKQKHELLERFKTKESYCDVCFNKGIKARIYRTWAGLITQIHAGYVAESVFGENTVFMSRELDSMGADIRVEYKGESLNYQVKKISNSGVRGGRPSSGKKLNGTDIDIFYTVPSCLLDPYTKKGEMRKPYAEFLNDTRVSHLPNGFVVFTPLVFQREKDKIDNSAAA